VVLGLVPKGNLIAALLAVVLASVRVNLATAALAAFVVSLVAPLCDPLTHRLGERLLTLESLQGFWTWLYNQPFAPWTAFNNTVVIGSLAAGLCLFYPVYRLARWPLTRYLPLLQKRLAQHRAARWFLGAEWANATLEAK
jgi:uncharacterized protein (TIGR03546 family)